MYKILSAFIKSLDVLNITITFLGNVYNKVVLLGSELCFYVHLPSLAVAKRFNLPPFEGLQNVPLYHAIILHYRILSLPFKI